MSKENWVVGFQPHLYCPHCGQHQVAEVTGYARYGLNVRGKCCKSCGEEFVVNIQIQTSVGGLEFQDMHDRMHTEKLKRVKKMMIQPLVQCPYNPTCGGNLIQQTKGSFKGYWECSKCECLWEIKTL